MKKGIIATAALAMVLGAGVAVCAHQPSVKGVGAVSAGTDIYLDVSACDWFSDSAKVAIWNHQGSCFEEFTADGVSGYYKTTLSADCTSFNLFRGNSLNTDWSGKWNQSDDASFDGAKNLIKSGAYVDSKLTFTWDTYSPVVTHSVDLYVDGSKVKTETVADGGLPAYLPDLTYSKKFSGWFDDAACSAGHEVTAITANGSVYSKKLDRGTFQFTLDTSRVNEEFPTEKLHGYSWFEYNEGNVQKAGWPGDAISSKTFSGVGVDTKIIINTNDLGHQTIDIDASNVNNDTLVIVNSTDGSGHYKAYWASNAPAEDGYYLVGTKTDWKFTDAPKLGTGDEYNYGNLIRYSATKDEEFKVVGFFNGESTWYEAKDATDPEGNYVVAQTEKVNVRLSKSDDKFVVETEIPDADGYYIKGSALDSWSWAGAVKMTNTGEPDPTENQATYTMSVDVDDEIRVCSYYTDRVTYLEWATVGASYDFGEVVGNNFKFSEDGSYDFYVKYSDGLKVYIAEHVEQYTIQMTAVLYNGAAYDTTAALPNKTAYAGTPFDPGEPAYSGYVFHGVYTDPDCAAIHTYSPTTYAADGHLYVKYIKVGYYLKSGATDWEIERAVLMQTEGISATNKAEALVTVAAVNETYLPVYYDASGTTHYPADGVLGKSYEGLATVEDGHIKFLKTGTFAIYWSDEFKGGDNKVYLNEGLAAFLTNFMSVTGGICKTDNTTSLSALKDAWPSFASGYADLSAAEKKILTDIGYDGGKEDGKDEEQFMARYAYILNRYGTANLSDFIFNETRPGNPAAINVVESNNNITIVAIVAITAISASLVLVLIRKRKHQ